MKSNLLAPNGKPSRLTAEQYKLVRTPEFKAWFGDWENDPARASKVVDENGEPLVVYHGSPKKFTKFRDSKYSSFIFFTNDKDHAEVYGDVLYECFLSIKNPSEYLYTKEYFKEKKQDGFINKYNKKNFFSETTRVYSVLKSNQIKLADGTNTTFDADNSDIRYDDGGVSDEYTNQKIKKAYVSIRINDEVERTSSWGYDYIVKSIDPKPFEELSNGVLDGVLGISTSSYNLSEWLVQRDCLVVMPFNDFLNLNDAEQVKYFDANYLTKNGLEPFFRLYNRKQNDDDSYYSLLQNIFPKISNEFVLEATSGVNGSLYSLVGEMFNPYNSSKFIKYVGEQPRIQSPEMFAQIVCDYINSGKVRDDYRYFEFENVQPDDIIKPLIKGIVSAGKIYRDESEWLLKDKKLVIPKGSQLFFVVPTYPNFKEENEKMIDAYGLRDLYRIGYIKQSDLNRFQQQRWKLKEDNFKKELNEFKGSVDKKISNALVDIENEILNEFERNLFREIDEDEYLHPEYFKDYDGNKYSTFMEIPEVANIYNDFLYKLSQVIEQAIPDIVKNKSKYYLSQVDNTILQYINLLDEENRGRQFEFMDEYGTKWNYYDLIYKIKIAFKQIDFYKYADSIKNRVGGDLYRAFSKDEIMFKEGGEVEDLISKGIVELKMYETTPEHAREYGIGSINPLYIQTICVNNDSRLKGIGKKVLAYIDEYARKNGNDVVFGHITQKAEFTKDERQNFFCDIDLIKNWLYSNGYAINNDNNDFHKVIQKNVRYNNGGKMNSNLLAPNGKPSNLTAEQYKLVRTPEFKAWFGDWENDPENASEVVDENGEPLVVYRGWSSNRSFGYVFNYNTNLFGSSDRSTSRKKNRFGFYFTPSKPIAEVYAEDFATSYNDYLDYRGLDKTKATPIVQSYFLNIRRILNLTETNPSFPSVKKLSDNYNDLIKNMYGSGLNKKRYKENFDRTSALYGTELGLKDLSDMVGLRKTDFDGNQYLMDKYEDNDVKVIYSWFINDDVQSDTIIREKIISKGYNGVFFKETTGLYQTLSSKEQKKYDQNFDKGIQIEYPFVFVAFEPNQIKLADGTNTTFNADNPDIRFNDGGEMDSFPAFFKSVKIEDGSKYIGLKFKDVFPFLYKKRTPNDFKLFVKRYYQTLDRILQDNYATQSMKQTDLNSIDWMKVDFDKKEYLSRFFLDSSGTIIDFRKGKEIYSDGGETNSNLLAPNGKPSKLTAEQYKLVRTQAFKDWFGDWENDPANASKVVDKNGEPLVVYHGTNNKFNTFEPTQTNFYAITKGTYFFTDNKAVAENFGEILLPVFLQIDNPTYLDGRSSGRFSTWDLYDDEGNYGFIVSNSDTGGGIATEYAVENPNQIKLADGTNTTFDADNPDIRFNNGGEMKKVDKGGITYGKSHDEGGIPVKNASTGQMLEVEGGEGIVNKRSMASDKMVKLNGKQMSICEAVSHLNQMEGGVKFSCDDVSHRQFIEEMELGGELERGIRTEKEHIETLRKLYENRITPNEAIKEVAKEHIAENPHYYSDLAKMEKSKIDYEKVQDIESKLFTFDIPKHFFDPIEKPDFEEDDLTRFSNGGQMKSSCGCQHTPKKYMDGGIFGGGLEQLESFGEPKKEDKMAELCLAVIDRARVLLNQDLQSKLLSSKVPSNLHKYFIAFDKINLYDDGWRFSYGKSKQWAGLCASHGLEQDRGKKTLYLSVDFVKHDELFSQHFEEVVYHEMAHAVVSEYIESKIGRGAMQELDPLHYVNTPEQPIGHGNIWKSICPALDSNCEMFYAKAKYKESFKNFKYECGNCGQKKYGNSRNFAEICFRCFKAVIVTKNEE